MHSCTKVPSIDKTSSPKKFKLLLANSFCLNWTQFSYQNYLDRLLPSYIEIVVVININVTIIIFSIWTGTLTWSWELSSWTQNHFIKIWPLFRWAWINNLVHLRGRQYLSWITILARKTLIMTEVLLSDTEARSPLRSTASLSFAPWPPLMSGWSSYSAHAQLMLMLMLPGHPWCQVHRLEDHFHHAQHIFHHHKNHPFAVTNHTFSKNLMEYFFIIATYSPKNAATRDFWIESRRVARTPSWGRRHQPSSPSSASPGHSVIVILMASVVVIVNVIVTNTINIFITAHFGSSPAPWETFWNVGVQVLR